MKLFCFFILFFYYYYYYSSLEVPLEEETLQSIFKMHNGQKNGKIDYELFYSGKKYVNKVCFES